tara:strand:+ start:4802 stop:5593 length:792 start_codon:yes stop_codon:yes gene_type:complete
MEHLLKFIHAKHPEKLHKRNILIPLSDNYEVEHTKYKNRTLLCEALLDKLTYNTTDPITLEQIEQIHPRELVAWWQNNKRFVARKTSIRSLIDSGHQMNPWVTDVASGIQSAENPELYDKMYNMTYVHTLMNDVRNTKSLPTSSSDVSEQTKEFFRFENLCDDLYTIKLTTVLQSSDSKIGLRIFLAGLEFACAQYYEFGDNITTELLEYMKYYTQIHIHRWIAHSNILHGIFEFFDYLSSIEPERTPDIIRIIIMNMNDTIN